jgi:hypothetical protein
MRGTTGCSRPPTYSAGSAPSATPGATYTRHGQSFTDLRDGFDGGDGQRMVTVDHDITVDGVEATQHCVALLLQGNTIRATGTYTDRLVYERGGWYFTSRDLVWDAVPRESALPV